MRGTGIRQVAPLIGTREPPIAAREPRSSKREFRTPTENRRIRRRCHDSLLSLDVSHLAVDRTERTHLMPLALA